MAKIAVHAGSRIGHSLAGVAFAVALVSLCALAANAQSGTSGRIAKFVTSTTFGNSALFEKGGRIGLGTTAPVSSLDIRSQNALSLWAATPFLTFRDTASNNAASRIQGSNGGMTFFGQSALNQSNPSSFVRIDREGRLGIGAATPQRAIQIGPNTDAMFTIEPSDGTPNAGYIRFGDGTGWELHFGRSRFGSGGRLTAGTQGTIMTIRDNSPSGSGGTVIVDGGLQVNLFGSGANPTPVCKNSLGLFSVCSSSRRYKTDIKPFSGGIELIDRLQPVSFVWRRINTRT
jgi:hypothetical protein